MIRYLYTPTVLRQGRPRLLTRDEIIQGRLQGFQSVFGYPEETQQVIAKQGNTRDIAHLPVYCDTLFVDFDDKEAEAKRFRNSLCECGIGYTMYESGNRSFHFHIPVSPVTGEWVPRACYNYVKQFAEGADLTIYKHSGLFRLAGTWHEKNPGHMKRELEHWKGETIKLEKPATEYHIVRSSEDAGVPLDIILRKKIDSGGRRCYVYTIGNVCYKRGIPFQQALEYALRWNHTCANPPLDNEIVCQKVSEAFK